MLITVTEFLVRLEAHSSFQKLLAVRTCPAVTVRARGRAPSEAVGSPRTGPRAGGRAGRREADVCLSPNPPTPRRRPAFDMIQNGLCPQRAVATTLPLMVRGDRCQTSALFLLLHDGRSSPGTSFGAVAEAGGQRDARARGRPPTRLRRTQAVGKRGVKAGRTAQQSGGFASAHRQVWDERPGQPSSPPSQGEGEAGGLLVSGAGFQGLRNLSHKVSNILK